jgi:hypothetical protein
MLRGSKLVRAFAIVGFCNGILVSALILLSEWRRFNLGGRASIVILLTLFPAVIQLWEFEGGKLYEIVILFVYSMVNGCLYGIIGLLFSYALETFRRCPARDKA